MESSLLRVSLSHGGIANSLPFVPAFPSFAPFQQCSPSNLSLSILKPPSSRSNVRDLSIRVSSTANRVNEEIPLIRKIKIAAKTVILISTVTAIAFLRFPGLPGTEETPVTLTEEKQVSEEDESNLFHSDSIDPSTFARTKPMAVLTFRRFPVSLVRETPATLKKEKQTNEPHSDFIDRLKSFFARNLNSSGPNTDAFKMLELLSEADPSENLPRKFFMATLLTDLREHDKARMAYEEILRIFPLNFETLLQNSLLLDQCGGAETVLKRLREGLTGAANELQSIEAREFRLVTAQIQFLEKNVDAALKSYQELAKEDPKDFGPYFCLGVICNFLGRHNEAKEYYVKCRELLQLQTPSANRAYAAN